MIGAAPEAIASGAGDRSDRLLGGAARTAGGARAARLCAVGRRRACTAPGRAWSRRGARAVRVHAKARR
ncbi:MAG: hypothetical protein MZW92_64535 [Comamonadaceae bacterium]|nr:hypothetical protein [Comamonadaceae bacterium]